MREQGLTPERFERLQRLFEQALELPAAARRDFLDAQISDAAERDEVLALLATHERIDAPLDRPVRLPLPVPNDDPAAWIGLRIGAWQVTRRIGFGGMGTVCEAVRADEEFQKSVAVKFLHRHAATQAAVLRFKAERQILANLTHPNIATLFDGGVTDDGRPYLVMEYVDGLPITKWCDERALTVRDRVRLFLQVCSAVEAAHRSLVVHLDIKPGNILVTPEGHVKLLDFGIARLLDREEDDSAERVNAQEPRLFTPDYAAPEQVSGQPVGTATDVYALGVVLYELLAKRTPLAVHDASTDEMARVVCEGVVRPTGTDADLDAVLLKALHKDQRQRYANASELRSELQCFLDGKPVAAQPDTKRYRLRKFIGRYRIASAAASVALLAVLCGAGLSLWQAQVAQRAAADTRRLNDFLLEVLQMSDPFDTGKEITLSEALDATAARIDATFADRPDLSAEIRFGIGYSMLSRYRLESAEQQLRRALEESRTEFGLHDIRTLRAMEGVAGLLHEKGDLAAAEAMYKETRRLIEASGLTADPLYVYVLGNLGNFYLTLERYPEAERALSEAVAAERLQDAPDALDHANLLSNLAHAAHGLEDRARAADLYERAQREYERLFPNGNPDLAVLINNRAMLAEELDELDTALALHRQSLAVREKVFGGEHPMIVTAMGNVARLTIAHDPNAAILLAERTAQMADRVYTAPNSRHATAYITLANALSASERHDDAVVAWGRAQALLGALDEIPPSTQANLQRVGELICRSATPAPALCGSLHTPSEDAASIDSATLH